MSSYPVEDPGVQGAQCAKALTHPAPLWTRPFRPYANTALPSPITVRLEQGDYERLSFSSTLRSNRKVSCGTRATFGVGSEPSQLLYVIVPRPAREDLLAARGRCSCRCRWHLQAPRLDQWQAQCPKADTHQCLTLPRLSSSRNAHE